MFDCLNNIPVTLCAGPTVNYENYSGETVAAPLEIEGGAVMRVDNLPCENPTMVRGPTIVCNGHTMVEP